MKKKAIDTKTITTEEVRNITQPKLNQYGQLVVAVNSKTDDYQVRKIDSKERRILILKFIYEHQEKVISQKWLAKSLAVSTKTIQRTLNELKKKGFIQSEEVLDPETHATLGYKFRYRFGLDNDCIDLLPSIHLVHCKGNTAGLRDWLWKDYKTIVGVYDKNHTAYTKWENYMELLEHKKDCSIKATKLRQKIYQRIKEEESKNPPPRFHSERQIPKRKPILVRNRNDKNSPSLEEVLKIINDFIEAEDNKSFE